jgi:hypothetical protein
MCPTVADEIEHMSEDEVREHPTVFMQQERVRAVPDSDTNQGKHTDPSQNQAAAALAAVNTTAQATPAETAREPVIKREVPPASPPVDRRPVLGLRRRVNPPIGPEARIKGEPGIKRGPEASRQWQIEQVSDSEPRPGGGRRGAQRGI